METQDDAVNELMKFNNLIVLWGRRKDLSISRRSQVGMPILRV